MESLQKNSATHQLYHNEKVIYDGYSSQSSLGSISSAEGKDLKLLSRGGFKN